ncbi:MAG: T9SS type A sorting domain-containing protein [Bacteroidota bacterium]
MKKITYLILSVLSLGTVFSQTQRQTGSLTQKTTLQPGSVRLAEPRSQDKAIVWSDNFSNPGTWIASSGSFNSDNWVIGTTGPSGSFPIDPIASTSAANGFALFDSDLMCSGDQIGYLQSTNAFNFTGQSGVSISFEQFYRKWTDAVYVEVSNDGGVNWTQYQVNATFAQNQTSATNPEVTTLDISPTAGNQSNVRIRFTYISGPGNGGDGCDYSWMVDDVSVSTTSSATSDLAILGAYSHDITNGYDYSIVANTQRRPLVVGGQIQNNSATAVTNKVLSVVINDGTSNVYTGSGTFSLAGSTTDFVWINTGFTPAINKNYTLTFTLPTDDNTANNSGSAAFKTMDYIYAHDYTATETAGFTIDDEIAIGAAYQIYSSTSLYGLDVEFATGTTVNMPVMIKVYQVGANIQDLFEIASANYTVPASAIGTNNTTTVYFDAPVNLTSNSQYVVEVRKEFGSNRLVIGASSLGDDDYGTVCYGPFGAGGAVNWWNGWNKSVAVRMNFNQGCMAFDATATASDAPTCNPNAGTIALDITTSGQTVSGQNTVSWTGMETGTSAPNQSNTYVITGLQAGTYDVTVSNNGCTSTIAGVVIGSIASPTLSINEIAPISCNGSSDGSISYSASGNTSGYSFSWEDGTTLQTRSGLGAGTYTINATDGVCSLTESFTLTQPAEIGITAVKQNVTTCGGNNGQINLTASGGSLSTYVYTWTGASTGTSGPGFGNTFSINDLTAGNYNITVTNGLCANSIIVSISENGAPPLTINETDFIACSGGMDGALQVTSTMNILPYTFTWSNGVNGTTISNIGAGTYTVTGTNGTCTTVASYELGQPLPLTVTGSAGVSSISTTVNGGTANYTYSWSGPGGFTSTAANLSNLTNLGTYTVIVTDVNGCTDNQSFTLNFVGMEEMAAAGAIKFYPNPANEAINFEVNSAVKTIRILDYTGKMISEIAVKNTLETLSLEGYANGVYFFNLVDGQNNVIHTNRFVVTK